MILIGRCEGSHGDIATIARGADAELPEPENEPSPAEQVGRVQASDDRGEQEGRALEAGDQGSNRDQGVVAGGSVAGVASVTAEAALGGN